MAMSVKMKIKKGDRVVVITGRDKGKIGTVLRAIPTESRVVVEGVNMVKRHTRQTARDQGGVVEKEGTIHVSNVAHVDPKSNKPTRVGFKNLEDGRKVRVARDSGEVIDV
ncbi:50S ribosomal protein L24 [Allostella sp. ATCC 35155]|nr:50S ribosomal protein L24 [Stella sp. ATCC 35155]